MREECDNNIQKWGRNVTTIYRNEGGMWQQYTEMREECDNNIQKWGRNETTIYRNEGGMWQQYTEMREECDNNIQKWGRNVTTVTTFDCHLKSMESWIDKKFSLRYWLQCTNSFSKSTKDVFNVHGAWYSQNMLLTMAHGQTFHIIIDNSSSIEEEPPGDTLGSSELNHGNQHYYPMINWNLL
jgi:hypothetical protein